MPRKARALVTLLGREAITAPQTLFIANDGSGNDKADGKTATPNGGSGPWASVQHAFNWVADATLINNARITLQLVKTGIPYVGGRVRAYVGSVEVNFGAANTCPVLRGDPAHPEDYVVKALGPGSAAIIGVSVPTPWFFDGLTLTNSGVPHTGGGILADFGSNLYCGTIVFGDLQYSMLAQWNSMIEVMVNSNLTFNGTNYRGGGLVVGHDGKILNQGNVHYSFGEGANFGDASGSPGFAFAAYGEIYLSGITCSGKFTGRVGSISSRLGMIEGANVLPGSMPLYAPFQ